MNTLYIVFFLTTIKVPGVQFDPGYSWFTIETEHFVIHFPARGVPVPQRLNFVRQVGMIAEEVRQTLQDGGVTVPQTPVQIVIADYYDYYNGYATPFPDNTIVILPFPPIAERANDDYWLRTLILHEFSHICQLDQCRGFPQILRRIFGRAVLPNALMPAWLLEGYAVYNETRFSTMGRLRSSEWRSQLYNAGVKTLTPDRGNTYELQRYPAGLAPYLFGSSLTEYGARCFGPAIWDRFNYVKSAIFPFFEELAFKKVFKKSTRALSAEWHNYLLARFDSLRQSLGNNLTQIKRLTDEGFDISAPRWSTDGSRIYYLTANGQEQNGIKELTLGTMTTRTIHHGWIAGNLSISRNGRYLAFTELVNRGNGYQQGDIFIYDLQTSKIKQLTTGERARDPDFAPDSFHLVYVSNCDGMSRLKILNYQTGEQKIVAELDNGDFFRQPRFSPAGNLIAVGVWRTGGYADIQVLDLKTGWQIPLTEDRANDQDPCWSRTGKFLYFISDRNGVNNLYAYGVESRKIYRGTNVLTGVFQPAVSPDNRRIALTILTPDGYDIGLIELNPGEWEEAEIYDDTLPEPDYHQLMPVMSSLYYYSPFPSVLPKFWLPWVNIGKGFTPGIFTLGWDVLQFHFYYVFAGYQYRNRTPQLNFTYELHRYRPILQLTGDFTIKTQESRIGLSLPITRTYSQQNAGLGVKFTHSQDIRMNFDIFYLFSNAQLFRFNVAPVQGRSFGIIADAQLPSLHRSSTLFRTVGYWREYLGRPPANWSLQPYLVLANGFGDTGRRGAFRIPAQPGVVLFPSSEASYLSAASAVISGLKFRIPVLWVERGLGVLPVFLQNINTAIFSEAALVSNNYFRVIEGWEAGIGIEFRTDLLIGHYLPLKLSIGSVNSVKNFKKPKGYLRLDSELSNEIFSRDKTWTLSAD